MEKPTFVTEYHLDILNDCYRQSIPAGNTLGLLVDMGLSKKQGEQAMLYFIKQTENSPEHLARIKAGRFFNYLEYGTIGILIILIVLLYPGR